MMKNKFRTIITLGLATIMMLSMSVTAFAEETDTKASNEDIKEILEVYEQNEGNGMLLAPNPNADDDSITGEDPYADDEDLQEIFEVYEENEGNGMLLAPNPNADDASSTDEDPYADDEELQEIFEVYEENEGNGMLLAPNPNADESISEVENSENVGFFGSIGKFFENIFDFVTGLFK